MKKKYELIQPRLKEVRGLSRKRLFYRLRALRDIPEHGVKAGDLGGYVRSGKNLSQQDSCWIGGEAMVGTNVRVIKNAYVGDNAVIYCLTMENFHTYDSYIQVGDNARVTGNAIVTSCQQTAPTSETIWKYIWGNSHIFGDARLDTVQQVSGSAKIYGNAHIHQATLIDGNVEIFDNAKINSGCSVTKSSKVFGNAILENNSNVIYSSISGDAVIFEGQDVAYGKVPQGKIFSVDDYYALKASRSKQVNAKIAEVKLSPAVLQYNEVLERIDSYQKDVVKIIKYPLMTDKTDLTTLKMMIALDTARRLLPRPESNEFKDAVMELEKAFMAAESNAQKQASSGLSKNEQKQLNEAKGLFRKAVNKSSTDEDKQTALSLGFQKLEGVIAVSEDAKDAFRINLGLVELES